MDNLINDYLSAETSSNKEWEETAEVYLPSLLSRLEIFDKHKKLPVLVTAERIYKFLIKSNPQKPKYIYSDPELIPFPPEYNKLSRPLIPFFRNKSYDLTRPEWVEYKIINFFNILLIVKVSKFSKSMSSKVNYYISVLEYCGKLPL